MHNYEMAKYVNKLYVDMQINETLPEEKYEIFIKPNYNTASWRFYDNKHQIVIGEDIFSEMVNNNSQDDKKNYLRSFLYHELAHSIWTEEDLEIILDVLRTQNYAFEVFNLFEDARIEEKMRNHTKKFFNWNNYETVIEPTNPIAMLFTIIQSERKKKELITLKNMVAYERQDTFKTVYNFYVEILKCTSSLELLAIIQKWYAVFPNTPQYIKKMEDNNLIFLNESKLLGDNKEFNTLIGGLTDVLGVDINAPISNAINNHKLKGSLRGSKSSSLLSKTIRSVPFDIKERDMLLATMKKMFMTPHRKEATEIPSKRLDIKRIISGDNKRFKRKSTKDIAKKNITIILDLSGSMYDTISNMRLLVDVLNKMVQNNIIDATLILTGTKGFSAIHEVLAMPLQNNVLQRIEPKFGGEGLHNTMSENINLLTRCDYVWILTDGFIDDKPLDKHYYHQYNIYTYAMYIGNTYYKEKMLESFDYVICEKNISDLGKVVLNLIKR